MATIYNLVTQLSADPAPMKAGFDRGLALVNSFASSANKALTSTPRNSLGQFTKFGSDAALATLSSLENTFSANQSRLKEALFRGALSERQFEEQSKANGQAFNRVLLNTITQIDLKKSVPANARQQLVDALNLDALNIDPFKKVGERFRSLGRDATQLGLELSFAITAPLAGGADAALKAADTMEHALAIISNSTGKTGGDLAGLNASFHKLFADLPNSADDIAKALTIISQVSGASGTDLEKLATQALDLSRITGTDLTANVTSSQHAFEAWGTAVAQQSDKLDLLFRVSQQTGTTVSSLGDSLSHFAPSLKQLGLGFAQSAALIGQFEKSGIDADSVLTTLQTSLSKFAEHGVDGAHALQLLVDSIKNASSDAEAINLAARIFGPRQAAQLASAVRSGKLDIQALTDSVRASSQGIVKAADSTDEFGSRMKELSHATTEVTAGLGNSLQRTFTSLIPLLTSLVSGVGAVVAVFTSLPQDVQTTVVILLTLAAGIGPLIFLLGGMARAIGAVTLAFGLLREVKAASAVADVAEAGAGAAAGLSKGAAGAGLFARGLALINPFSIAVIATIGTLVGAFGAMTKESRDAKARLDEFKTSLQGLSQQQLTIKTTELQQQLDDRAKQVSALEAQISGIRATTQPNDAGVSDSVEVLRKKQGAILAGNGAIEQSLFAVGQAFLKVDDATQKAADDAAAFQAAIAQTIKAASTGLKIDDHGQITGPVDNMRKAVAKLKADLSSTIPVKGLNVDAANSAIEHLQQRIDQLENNGKNIKNIFPQLSPDVAELEREISALVGHAQSLGGTLQQLGDAHLSTTLLDQYKSLSDTVAKLGDRTDIDAQKFRELKKALEGTAAVQIGGNVGQTSTFTVDVDARIRRIIPDQSAGAAKDFVQFVRAGLDEISSVAQQAAAAQQNLVKAEAGGSAAQIVDAQREVERASQRVVEIEDQYRRAILRSNASLSDQQDALAEIAKIEQQVGFDAAKAALSSKNIIDAKSIGASLSKELDALPPPELGVKLFVDSLTIDEVARRTQTELTKAQIQALAGAAGLSNVTRNRAIDDLGKQFQELGRTMDIRNPSQADIAEFQRIAAAASKLGISLEDVAKRQRDLTTFGKADRLATELSNAAAAALGADSAVAKLAASIAQGVSSAHDLKDAFNGLKSGGGFDSILSGIGAIGGLIGSIKSIGSAIGGLLGFGESAIEKEHDQILNANNQALKQLKLSLDRQAGTAGRASQLAAAAIAAQTRPFSRIDEAMFPEVRKDAAGFAAELAKYNLTIDQADAAAKALGITLFDSKHHLVGLDQFADALAAEAKIITTLGSDLNTQQKLIAVQNAISGRTADAQSTLQDQLIAISKVAPNIGQTLIQANQQGGAALRAALQKLIDGIKAGTISIADLGGFQNVADLLDALGTTADDLNALAGAASDVTDALLNVPAGFKKALAEFNAQLPQTGPTAPTPPVVAAPPAPPPPPTDTTPTRPPDTTGPLLDIVKQLTAIAGKVNGAPAAIGGPVKPTPIPGKVVALELTHPEDIKPLSIPASLIRFTQSQPVTVPSPELIVAKIQPIALPAPTFHVEQSATVSLAAPSLSVQPFAPLALAAPTVTLSGALASISLAPPDVEVRPLPAIHLGPPDVRIGATRPVEIPAPTISIPPSRPIRLDPPKFRLAQSTQTLTVPAPAVRLSGDLATVALQPPPVEIAAYRASVQISPPSVSIGALADVHLPSPPMSIDTPDPVELPAPSFRVPALASISLARPNVIVQPLNDIALDAPKVTVAPLTDLTLKAPKDLNAPEFKMPDLTLPSDQNASDAKLARALALLAQKSTSSDQPGSSGDGDVHIHGPLNIQSPAKSVAELFTDIKKQAQKIAHQKTGDSTRIIDAFAQ